MDRSQSAYNKLRQFLKSDPNMHFEFLTIFVLTSYPLSTTFLTFEYIGKVHIGSLSSKRQPDFSQQSTSLNFLPPDCKKYKQYKKERIKTRTSRDAPVYRASLLSTTPIGYRTQFNLMWCIFDQIYPIILKTHKLG